MPAVTRSPASHSLKLKSWPVLLAQLLVFLDLTLVDVYDHDMPVDYGHDNVSVKKTFDEMATWAT